MEKIALDKHAFPCYNIACCWTADEDAGVAQPVEQLICNQQVGGSNPSTSSTTAYGGVPEWPKGADCKSVAFRFGGSNPPSSTTSSRTAYRSRRRFLFQSKRHLSLIPSLLLIQTEPAALGFGLGACDEFFYKKLIVRSFCYSSLSPHKRCAGLHSDKGALRGRRFSYCPHKGPAKRAL